MLRVLVLCVLLQLCGAARLMEYIGYDHVVVFDSAQARAAAYDLRKSPRSAECDILHFPPVAPPTLLTDYVSVKLPADPRIVRVGQESFVVMDGKTGSYTLYECSGFQPFLSGLPCKVAGVGQAPMFAGNVHLFASTPSRVLAYNEASGEVSLHFVDSDVSSASSISRLPIGRNDNKLSVALPHTAGTVSLAVLTGPGWLVVLNPNSHEVRVFEYNPQAQRREEWIGAEVSISIQIPHWAAHLIATSESSLIAYNSETSQYVSIQLHDHQFATSSSQTFFEGEGARGFLPGHACLVDTLYECLQSPGCGWCVSNQRCVHAANKIACDELECTIWCPEENLSCVKADEAHRVAAGPRPVVQHPANLTSPKDVDLGHVVAPAVLGAPAIDVEKVATGTHFHAPENNSVNCMNAGANGRGLDGETGCNDNEDKQFARQGILNSIENMNSYEGSLVVHKKSEVPMPAQMSPGKDCVELDEDGIPMNLTADAPLKEGDGDAPVPISENGGRWGMQPALSVTVDDNTVTKDHGNIRLAHTHQKAMTEKRMRRIQERLRATEPFAPASSATVSGHDTMNNRQNKYTELNARGDRMSDGNAMDQSRLSGESSSEVYVPPVGAPAPPSPRVVAGEAKVMSHSVTKARFEQQYSHLLTRALAAGSGVSLNQVQIGHVVPKSGALFVDFTISSRNPSEVLEKLRHSLEAGDVQQEMNSHGLETTIVLSSEFVSPSAGEERYATHADALSSADMEGGCGDGDAEVPISLTPNFMNGAALARVPDDDGEKVQGSLVGTLTEKGVGQMTQAELIHVLREYHIAPPMHDGVLDRSKVHALLLGVATPSVVTSNQAGRFATPMLWDGSHAHQASVDEKPTHIAEPHATYPVEHLPVVDSNPADIIQVDPTFQSRSAEVPPPVASGETAPVPAPHEEAIQPLVSEAVAPPSETEDTVSYPPHPPLPEGGGDLYAGSDGTFNPIDLKVASNSLGLPADVAPLDSQQIDPYQPLPNPPSTANVWGKTSTVVSGQIVNDVLVPHSLLQIDQDVADSHFSLKALPAGSAHNIGVEVDPLTEYRNLDTEEDSEEVNLKHGCVSTEDPYTGNSQPRIDYLGNNQILHVQPLIGVYGVYNLTSGADTSTGEVPVPFRPVRRTFLGGPDNRLLEHYPLTGVFKFFKCASAVFEECVEYASGQWDKTVHPNDQAVVLTPHLVMLHNLDTGSWRIFNFDRDVSGSADPFSTATPPLATGAFPDAADHEVVLLAPGTLLVNNPRSSHSRVFKFDPVHKTIVGPTHSGSIIPTEGVDPQRVTSVGDHHLVVYKPRSSHYRLFKCSEGPSGTIECDLERLGTLHSSSGFEHNPVLTTLLHVQSVRHDSLSWAGDLLTFIREGKAVSVSGDSATVEASPSGQVPFTVYAPAGVVAVIPRPHFPHHVLVVTDPTRTSDPQARPTLNHQLSLLDISTGHLTPITLNKSLHHSSPRFSPDGAMLAFTATPEVGEVTVFISELRALLEHGTTPSVVKTYPETITLGPMSNDARFLVVAVPSNIPNDNNIEAIDIFSGHVVPLTQPSPNRQPSEWLVDEAVFHPLLPLLLVVSNYNSEHYGVQALPIQPHAHSTTPLDVHPHWLISLDKEDAISLSCDAFVTRCAVTFVDSGYADWQVFDIKLDSNNTLVAEAISRPFFLNIKAAPTPIRISSDASRLAVVKETPDAPGQVFIAKIVTTVRILEPPGPSGTATVTTVVPPTPIPPEITTKVSILQMVTSSVVEVPAIIDALPAHGSITIPARDGLPIHGFLFPPSLKSLLVDVLQPANRSSAAPLVNGTRPMIKVNQTLSRRPAYVILVHDGPHQSAPPSLWRSPTHRALQALRALGVGVLVPNIRGSSGAGTLAGLMAAKDKRGNAIADIKAVRDYLCLHVLSDCDNIFLMGDGYGGMLTLNALATYPTDFKAGISFAAIVNLPFHVASPILAAFGPELRREYSDDQAVQSKFSPSTHLDDIQAPVLVIHGTSDTEVASGQAEIVVSRLSSNHRVVKYLPLHNDGHTITNAENVGISGSTVTQFVLENAGYLN